LETTLGFQFFFGCKGNIAIRVVGQCDKGFELGKGKLRFSLKLLAMLKSLLPCQDVMGFSGLLAMNVSSGTCGGGHFCLLSCLSLSLPRAEEDQR